MAHEPSTAPEATSWVAADELAGCVSELMQAAGFPAEDATQAADVLVSADVRGVETHGVSNLLRKYLEWAESGHLNPTPAVKTVREGPSTATLDSDDGLGVVVIPRAMRMAIDKAGETGVGMVCIRSGRHAGMLAYHAMLALPHDMIGVCSTAVGPRMVPTFGREARLGTNPLAVAVPAGAQEPFVYDASMTTVAYNKVNSARRRGQPLPAGAFAALDGTPLAELLPSDENVEGRMLPLGSYPDTGSHKGYGLACVVEVLSSMLSGGMFVSKLGPGFANHMVMALDVSSFTDPAEFKREMDDFLTDLRSTPPAAGRDRVLVPGQLEAETAAQRRETGVPLHPEVVGWLTQTCDQLGVRSPWVGTGR